MNDAYLRETVGPMLAEGIAETLEANPSNPVHFLGKWILDQLDRRAEAAQVEPKAAALRAVRERWQEETLAMQTYAACRIQTAARNFLQRVRRKNERSHSLAVAITDARTNAEAAYVPQLEPSDDRTEQEVELDAAYERAALEMASAKAALAVLTPSDVAQFALPLSLRPADVHQNTLRIIRAMLYTCRDASPPTLATPTLVLAHLKPRLAVAAKGCDVVSHAARRRGLQRARRLARVIDFEADASRTADSPVESAFSAFVAASVELRRVAEDRVGLLRALGRDAPDLNIHPDDDDDVDGEDEDVAFVKRLESEERAALAAEVDAEAEVEED